MKKLLLGVGLIALLGSALFACSEFSVEPFYYVEVERIQQNITFPKYMEFLLVLYRYNPRVENPEPETADWRWKEFDLDKFEWSCEEVKAHLQEYTNEWVEETKERIEKQFILEGKIERMKRVFEEQTIYPQE